MSGLFFLYFYIHLLTAVQASETGYSDYWNRQLAEITGPLQRDNREALNIEAMKTQVDELRKRMIGERTELTALAKEYQTEQVKQAKRDEQQAALDRVNAIRSKSGAKGKEFQDALNAYFKVYNPKLTAGTCERSDKFFIRRQRIDCEITDSTDKGGGPKTRDLAEVLSTEGQPTAIANATEGVKIAESLRKLRALTHRSHKLDDGVIDLIAKGDFERLEKGLGDVLRTGDNTSIDDALNKALKNFVNNLFTNQRAATTLAKKLEDLLASSNQSQGEMDKFMDELDRNIAETAIGNFVERTALGIACTIKDNPDMLMCGGDATALSGKIHDARKTHGKPLLNRTKPDTNGQAATVTQ